MYNQRVQAFQIKYITSETSDIFLSIYLVILQDEFMIAS